MYKETDYRGQHVIRETIKRKAEELRGPVVTADVNPERDARLWAEACDIVYKEFVSEGLTSSAEQVLDHKRRGK